MKLSLVVAEGVHKGKAIPVPVAEFVIGRDPDCQLRPSSPAVSKRHCAINVKADKVFVKDFGSTNGTFVNGEPVSGETEVQNGDKLVVGPLVFEIKFAAPTPGQTGTKGDSKAEQKSTAGKTPAPKPPTPKPEKSEKTSDEEAEQAAAMLLGTDDGPAEPLKPSDIPEGSTVFDVPAVGSQPADPKKPAEPLPTTSSAADAILRKYMRRPRS